mmetsp:Transcript_76732/g.169543  ORF Transcript_76732/g.169543 Transcript_76732/m.169543 type:complete len:115 (-) Transcript_76732:847-1191(-)
MMRRKPTVFKIKQGYPTMSLIVGCVLGRKPLREAFLYCAGIRRSFYLDFPIRDILTTGVEYYSVSLSEAAVVEDRLLNKSCLARKKCSMHLPPGSANVPLIPMSAKNRATTKVR